MKTVTWMAYGGVALLALAGACSDEGTVSSVTGQTSSGSAQGGAGGHLQAGAGGALATGGAGGESVGPQDPGYPDFPEVVGTVTVTVRTADIDFAGTNDGHLSLYLNDSTCFLLDTVGTASDNQPWPNEFQRGEVDTFHFEGVALPRSAVDRVELRTSDGENAFTPACIAVRFDGEPVHCNDDLNVLIGNGSAAEVTSFEDPQGLHPGCASCYPEPTAGGPMLGAVTDDSARLWLRTDATRRVKVLIATEDAPDDKTLVAYSYPSPLDDFVGEVFVAGLLPGQNYLYQFDIDGRGLTPTYPFTTAPQPGGQITRIAIGSCSRGYPAPIYAKVVERQPDMFIHLGDNHYANANYAGQTDSERLAILRWHYRRSLMQPERALLAASIPSLAVWDDHDYVGNNTIGSAPGKEMALRVFDEYWANTSLGATNVPGTFSKESYGDVDVFLLDDRYYRSPESNASGSILGAAQTQWLEAELLASTAVFKLVVSGSLFSRAGETWKDFPAARASLFDFMAQNQVTGVVLLSGDVHRSIFRRLPRPSGYSLPEIVSSPLNTGNSNCSDDPDAEDIACFDALNYFATLDVDTTLADPELVATIVNELGDDESVLVIKHSELQ